MVLYGTQVNPVVHANWGKLLPSLLCLVGGGGGVRHAEGLSGRQLNSIVIMGNKVDLEYLYIVQIHQFLQNYWEGGGVEMAVY